MREVSIILVSPGITRSSQVSSNLYRLESSHAGSAAKDPHGSRRVTHACRLGVRESVILGTHLLALDVPQFSDPAQAGAESPPAAPDRQIVPGPNRQSEWADCQGLHYWRS